MFKQMQIPSVRDRRNHHRNREPLEVHQALHYYKDKEFFFSRRDAQLAFNRYARSLRNEYLGFTSLWTRHPDLTKRSSLDDVARKLRTYAAENPGRFKYSCQLTYLLWKDNNETTNRNNKRLWQIYFASENTRIMLPGETPTGYSVVESNTALENSITQLMNADIYQNIRKDDTSWELAANGLLQARILIVPLLGDRFGGSLVLPWHYRMSRWGSFKLFDDHWCFWRAMRAHFIYSPQKPLEVEQELFQRLYGYWPKLKDRRAYRGITYDDISKFETIVEHGIYIYEIAAIKDHTLRKDCKNPHHIVPKLVREAADFPRKIHLCKFEDHLIYIKKLNLFCGCHKCPLVSGRF